MTERKVALFDIDNTLYNGFFLFEAVRKQAEKKMISQSASNKIHKGLKRYRAGELDYETFAQQVLIDWAAALRGRFTDAIYSMARDFIEERKGNFFPFVWQLFSMLNEKGYDSYFVTGEPNFIAEPVKDIFGGSGYLATEFETDDSGPRRLFTGNVANFLASREQKQTEIRKLFQNHDLSGSFAFGDSEADIEMLELVENSVCINPRPGLDIVAKNRGWIVTSPDEALEVVAQKISAIGE